MNRLRKQGQYFIFSQFYRTMKCLENAFEEQDPICFKEHGNKDPLGVP